MSTPRQATSATRRGYDAYAPAYDRETGWYEHAMLGDGRAWACSHARGRVLEIAVGNGLNLPHYPPGTELTAVDLSRAMLARACPRARAMRPPARLLEGDAQRLPLADGSFDTVVCTLGLSAIPDDRAALAHIHRVLRPGGHLVLLGHVASPHPVPRAVQHLLEHLARRRVADRQRRDVAALVRAAGFTVTYRHASRRGMIERLVAVKPAPGRYGAG